MRAGNRIEISTWVGFKVNVKVRVRVWIDDGIFANSHAIPLDVLGYAFDAS